MGKVYNYKIIKQKMILFKDTVIGNIFGFSLHLFP